MQTRVTWGLKIKLSVEDAHDAAGLLRKLARENERIRSDLKQVEKRADALADEIQAAEGHEHRAIAAEARVKELNDAIVGIRSKANSVMLVCDKCDSALGADGYCVNGCLPF